MGTGQVGSGVQGGAPSFTGHLCTVMVPSASTCVSSFNLHSSSVEWALLSPFMDDKAGAQTGAESGPRSDTVGARPSCLPLSIPHCRAGGVTGKGLHPHSWLPFCCLHTDSLPSRWTLTAESHLPHSSEQSEGTGGITPTSWHHLQPGVSWLGLAMALPTYLSTQFGHVAISTQHTSPHTNVSMNTHPPGRNLPACGHSAPCTFPLTVTHINYSSSQLLCARECSGCSPSTI